MDFRDRLHFIPRGSAGYHGLFRRVIPRLGVANTSENVHCEFFVPTTREFEFLRGTTYGRKVQCEGSRGKMIHYQWELKDQE